jgi:hypothetical protein
MRCPIVADRVNFGVSVARVQGFMLDLAAFENVLGGCRFLAIAGTPGDLLSLAPSISVRNVSPPETL